MLPIPMTSIITPCSESTLTDRYQTTVPESVRKALGLNKRDKICYTIQSDGRVLKSKIIIFAWVNDETSKRAYESNTDAYRVFKKMLENGNPPDHWDNL